MELQLNGFTSWNMIRWYHTQTVDDCMVLVWLFKGFRFASSIAEYAKQIDPNNKRHIDIQFCAKTAQIMSYE